MYILCNEEITPEAQYWYTAGGYSALQGDYARPDQGTRACQVHIKSIMCNNAIYAKENYFKSKNGGSCGPKTLEYSRGGQMQGHSRTIALQKSNKNSCTLRALCIQLSNRNNKFRSYICHTGENIKQLRFMLSQTSYLSFFLHKCTFGLNVSPYKRA